MKRLTITLVRDVCKIFFIVWKLVFVGNSKITFSFKLKITIPIITYDIYAGNQIHIWGN